MRAQGSITIPLSIRRSTTWSRQGSKYGHQRTILNATLATSGMPQAEASGQTRSSAVTTSGGASVCRRANEVCGDVPLSCRSLLAATTPVWSSPTQALRLAVSPDSGEAAFLLQPGTISA